MSRPRRSQGLLLLALTPILLATLVPTGGPLREPSWCLWCDARASADALLNVLLFLPLGLALAYRYPRSWSIVGVGALLSIGIELAQTHIPGRDPSLADVVSNSTGAVIGIVLQRTWAWEASRARRHPRLGAAILAVLGVASLACGALLLAPAVPVGSYWVRWGTSTDVAAPFEGSVSAASIGILKLWPGPVARSAYARAGLLGGIPLEVDARVQRLPAGLAGVLGVSRGNDEVATLGLDGRAAVFRLRTRGAALRLTQTAVSFPDAVRGGAPLRVALRGWRAGRGYCVQVDGRTRCGLGYTIGDGWRLVIGPDRMAGGTRAALAALWILGLLAPAGFWLTRAGDRLALSASALAVVLGVPTLSGILPTPPLQSLAALAGPWMGAVLRFCWMRWQGRRPARARSDQSAGS